MILDQFHAWQKKHNITTDEMRDLIAPKGGHTDVVLYVKINFIGHYEPDPIPGQHNWKYYHAPAQWEIV